MNWGAECWVSSKSGKGGKKGGGGSGMGRNEAGIQVEWSSHRASVFFLSLDGEMFVVDLMADDSAALEGGYEVGRGNEVVFGRTKGARGVGSVLLVYASGGKILARQISDDFVIEKKTLCMTEDDEIEWMQNWVDNVVS